MAAVSSRQHADVDREFVSEMLSSPLCQVTDSGVSTDTGSVASEGEKVAEIVDVALDLALSSDSDDADKDPATPAPRLKFNRQRPTPSWFVWYD